MTKTKTIKKEPVIHKEPLEHIEFIKEKKHIVSLTYDINYPKLKQDLINFEKIENVRLKIIMVKLKIMYYTLLVIINKGIRKHNSFWEHINFKKEGS